MQTNLSCKAKIFCGTKEVNGFTILKKFFHCFLFFSSSLAALPQGAEVKHGKAEFSSESSDHLTITASDKTIIHYDQFNIGEKEGVRFVQPHAKATLLNRITGTDPSRILGKLEGNGRVFFVNPSGIFFGPQATVNIGSFVASTLDIADVDFLEENYTFSIGPGKGTIINEGAITSSPDGFIVLLAPVIQNKGSIIARADKIVLASAERVTLDFSGDGLLQFKAEGELEKALIENYGKIESAGGVELSIRTAQKAIRAVVNTNGLAMADTIVEENGVIRLVAKSQISGEKIAVEGAHLEVSGQIEAPGGEIHLLGDRVLLQGADLDVSDDFGGGTVLVGGGCQGKGTVRNALWTEMDRYSQIHADAKVSGDGGKVILWADDTTLFNGKITARGGSKGGHGGFVETSGKENLGVAFGHVDTSASLGKYGDWLMDPASINVVTGGGGSLGQASNCASNGSVSIDPTTIALAMSNVTLCAQNSDTSSITITDPVALVNDGSTLTLLAGSTNEGPININNSMTTRGGAISITGQITIGSNITLDTTNGGSVPAGANITVQGTVAGTGNLSLVSGTGSLNFLSDITSLGALTVTSATNASFQGISATSITSSGITGTATFNGDVKVSSLTGINIQGVATTFFGNVNASNGPISIVNSGLLTTPAGKTLLAGTTFTQSGAGNINLAGGIVANGAVTLGTMAGPNGTITLIANAAINSNGSGITVWPTVDGNFSWTLASASTGDINLKSTVGGISRIGAFQVNNVHDLNVGSIYALSIAQLIGSGTFSIGTNMAPGILDTTGSTGIRIAGTNFSRYGSLTTANGGPVVITNSGTFTEHTGNTASISGSYIFNGTGSLNLVGSVTSAAGVSIAEPITLIGDTTLTSGGALGIKLGVLNNDAMSAHTLTLNGGLGPVSLAAIGQTTPIGNITISNPSTLTTAAVSAASFSCTNIGLTATFNGAIATSGSTGVVVTGPVVTFNDNVTTTGSGPLTVTNSQLMTLKSGITVSLAGAFSQSGLGSLSLGGSVSSGGAMNIAGAVILTGNTTFTSSSGNIGFSGNIAGQLNNLSILALSGNIQLDGLLKEVNTFTGMGTAISHKNISVSGAVQETGVVTLLGGITTAGNDITLTGNVISSAPSITLTTGGGTGNIRITGTLNPDIAGRSLTLSTGTGNVTLDSTVGANTSFSNLTISGNNLTLNDFGATNPASTGTVSFTATNAITMNGATYKAGGLSLTAGTNFNLNKGSLMTLTSTNQPITFNTGTIQLSSGSDLTIISNGGDVTLTDLFGSLRSLNINTVGIANTASGSITVGHIGTLLSPLLVINIRGSALIHPFQTFPVITFILNL